MITQLPLLIVSLLVAVTQATEFEYKIEPDRCKVDTACYIRQSCIKDNNDASDKTTLAYFAGDESLTDPGKCDVFVQIKALSKKKYLVLMELTLADSSTVDFSAADHTKGINIFQDGVKQMACENGVDNPTGNDNLVFGFKGSNSRQFEEKRMFCAFTVTTKDGTSLINTHFTSLAGKYPSLEYSLGGTEIKLEYSIEKDDFWTAKKATSCEQDNLSSSDGSFNLNVVTEADTSKTPPIKCDNGKLIVKYKGNEIEANDMFCGGNKWKWNIIPSGLGKADPGEPLEIGCFDKKVCETCVDLVPTVANCNDCGEASTKVIDPDTKCVTYTCPDAMWTLDGKTNRKGIAKKQVICGKHASGTLGWFFHDNDAAGEEVLAGASCRSVVDCTLSEFDVTKCPPDEAGTGKCLDEPKLTENGTIICPGGGVLHNNDVMIAPEKPSCDRKTGTWGSLTAGNLYCVEEKAYAAPNTGGDSSMLPMVGGIIAAIVIIVAIALIAIKVVVPRMKKGKGAAHGGATSKKTGKLSSKKSSEKSKSKSGDLKKSDSDPIEKQADEDKAKPAADAAGTPATPAGDKPPPTTDIEGLKTDKDGKTDPPTPSNPKVPPTPSPAAPAGALPV